MDKEPRPKSVPGQSHRVRTQCGNLYITVNVKDNAIFEVFATLGKCGGCMYSNMSALTTAITMGIRHGVNAQVYVDKLKGINCSSKSWEDGILYTSCADAIAQVMEEVLKELGSQQTIDTKGEDTNASKHRTAKDKKDNLNKL